MVWWVSEHVRGLTLSPGSPLQPGVPIRPVFPWRFPTESEEDLKTEHIFSYTGEWRLTFWPSVPSLPDIPAVPWVFGHQQVVLKYSWMCYNEIIHIYEALNQLFTFAPVAPVSPCSEELTSFALAAYQRTARCNHIDLALSTLSPFSPMVP